jgi:(2Fe-2S) ferredoxin
MKQHARALGVDKEGGLMINKSGCFGLCQSGPNVVVYPTGEWLAVSTAEQAVALIDRLAGEISPPRP